MLLTTRLGLAKQTHGDNVNLWDVPLNSNFQKLDDDLSDLATVLTGSETGDWTDFQTNVLNDITYAGDSGLGDNPTETLAGRAHYDQEGNLVSAPTFTVARKPQMRGGFFNDGAIVGSENSYAHHLVNTAITASYSAPNLEINFEGGRPMDIIINGQKFRFNRSITVTKSTSTFVSTACDYFAIYACNKPMSSVPVGWFEYNAQKCRTSAVSLVGSGSKGGSVFTTAGGTIGIADAGENSWQPKAGDTLIIVDGGQTYRFKVKQRTGNTTIDIYGKFPKDFTGVAWEIHDFRQPVFYIHPLGVDTLNDGDLRAGTAVALTGSQYYLEILSSATSYVHVGWAIHYTNGGLWYGTYLENSLARMRGQYGKRLILSLHDTLPWSNGVTQQNITMPIPFHHTDILRNITFYVQGQLGGGTYKYTLYNPVVKLDPAIIGSTVYVPAFAISASTKDPWQSDTASTVTILRTEDYQTVAVPASVGKAFRMPHDDGSMTLLTYAEVTDWGIIIDLDI